MKKAVAFLMLIVLCFSMSSCYERHDGVSYKTHNKPGISYKLPKDFKATNFGYGELEYSNGEGAYFFFSAFDEDELQQDQFMPADTTAQEYAQTCITVWGVDSEYVYNPQNNSATFDYYIEEDGEYYRHLVVRTSDEILLFTLSCYSEDVQEYDSVFNFVYDSIALM